MECDKCENVTKFCEDETKRFNDYLDTCPSRSQIKKKVAFESDYRSFQCPRRVADDLYIFITQDGRDPNA
jgi:hypothetical protein